ncbi:PaaX family transcriptional regulator C-terminal domain-containing protein [Streptomyces sp. H10-C2]|uniref:PaaX family transcriptional regulator n=1 Tax=unclassified Streptomyces TaxID=2593676 RepID=UPI0024BB3F92|nr:MULTISPECIES: PaaX family transcriptional regulator C-terminal domain-containing protein [unclassified Streptomyces]MDJ0345858.1 PaaX family transcriptional regulator C-terminal domain-containing protein [Streptomyces sp. PH10-H1]MDJ0371176.1 PaaX family transcriptional regulator C-terminal domain-containing protein [Streptomyces sp. H10-C2]
MSDSPTRPSSVINTVYGAFLRRLGGWISIADLITLMSELDVDSPAVRSAISRLKKRGVLEPERQGATGYRVSPAVHRVFDEGDRRIFGSLEPADLSDGWVMAVFSVPESERSQRYQLRTRLTWLGFGNIASGVWLAPGRLLDDTRRTLVRLGLDDYVHLFAADYAAFSDLRTTVSSWWDFPAIQTQYAAFTDTYAPVAERLTRQSDLDTTEAFRHYVPMLTQWRRLPYLDPGLPTELLPADWNAVAARQVFQQLHLVLAEPSLRHVQKVTGLAEVTPRV